MNLDLGRRADYSLRAVLDLARHEQEGGLRKARDIAAAMGIPLSYLPQLLASLVAAGIADSVPGRVGGYHLARASSEITLLDVVDAVEPEESPTCVLRGGPCDWDGRCPFHEPWAAAKQALRERLDRTTFAQIRDLDDVTPRSR